MGKTKKKEDPTASVIEAIDREIEELEKKLEKYYPIREKIDRLRAARRALTGGNRLTGSGGTRIRQEDVVEYLKANPGSTPSQIAQAIGGTFSQVSSHLSRGRDERFLGKNRRWWVRDPKNGLNTVEDLDQEEDEDDE